MAYRYCDTHFYIHIAFLRNTYSITKTKPECSETGVDECYRVKTPLVTQHNANSSDAQSDTVQQRLSTCLRADLFFSYFVCSTARSHPKKLINSRDVR